MNRRDYAFTKPQFPQAVSVWTGFFEALLFMAVLVAAFMTAECLL